ncbi:MAG: PQQ-binding-like beta-propeller repeat protein, partial [Gammaproteobacteria bacterium]|nr:PQQ-binding-like beta-propeller repeat protein [Gammaproteobacteria bacterium]
LGLNAIQQMVPVNANLIANNGVVYAAAYQGNVAAIDGNSGNILWQQPISSYAGFALSANALIVSTNAGHLVALDKRTGKTLWRQTALTGRKLTTPVIVGNNVVVADNAGDVHWLNTSNGQFVARMNFGKTPIYADLVAKGQDVWVYNATGQIMDIRTPNA